MVIGMCHKIKISNFFLEMFEEFTKVYKMSAILRGTRQLWVFVRTSYDTSHELLWVYV